MTVPKAILQQALAWASHGNPVLPLHSTIMRNGKLRCTCGDTLCHSPAKHPIARLVPEGLKNATTDPAQINRWWQQASWANLGVATGYKITVLDVDVGPDKHGDSTLAELESIHGELPLTQRVITGGGGEHILFQTPKGIVIRNSAGRLGKHLDMRDMGGYIVAPVSLHISGRRYEWSVDHHPNETKLAPLPNWIIQALQYPAKNGQPAKEWRKAIGAPIPEGKRNDTIARLIGHCSRRGVDQRLTTEMMMAYNVVYCHPPLDPDEVLKIVASIARLETQRRAANG